MGFKWKERGDTEDGMDALYYRNRVLYGRLADRLQAIEGRGKAAGGYPAGRRMGTD
ncbi:MAG: hypothetical protein PUD47_10065 [Bacteroidales bacterium]|nr:hypothetical protein [Bacteroidales bacterium]